jgi:hypothetical protein
VARVYARFERESGLGLCAAARGTTSGHRAGDRANRIAVGDNPRRFDNLITGCWPAVWAMTDHPVVGGEVDVIERSGDNDWPRATCPPTGVVAHGDSL